MRFQHIADNVAVLQIILRLRSRGPVVAECDFVSAKEILRVVAVVLCFTVET